jgi:hypothetical protein
MIESHKIDSGNVVQVISGTNDIRGSFWIVENQIDDELYTVCYSICPKVENKVIRTDWLQDLGQSGLVISSKYNPQ